MTTQQLKELVQDIVKKANTLKNKFTDQINAPVNYACIFCHSEAEYEELRKIVMSFGKVLEETHSGPLFHIKPVETTSGKLQILKIRMPDNDHPELGDADFTVTDYELFKKTYLNKSGFKLIERPKMEMIELMDSKFNVRAYFSNPPVGEEFGVF